MADIILTDIVIYPIKSLNGIHLKSASVAVKGLKHDRRWMLVDNNGRFLTQRQNPELIFFNVEDNGNGFDISHRQVDGKISIPYHLTEGIQCDVTIWDDTVSAVQGKEEWSKWLSEVLGFHCDIVYMPEITERAVKKQWTINGETVSFADAYPYLIIGESSLEELNSKIGEIIEMKRFRPNLVVKGGEAYEEFRWKEMTIGDNRFTGLKPCERCVMTTINPITGVKGKEPLKTLFRQKINDKMVFGQHALAIDHGTIHVGDKIEIISFKDSPYDPL